MVIKYNNLRRLTHTEEGIILPEEPGELAPNRFLIFFSTLSSSYVDTIPPPSGRARDDD